MTLSHCVVVRKFLVGLSTADGVSVTGGGDGVSADGMECQTVGWFFSSVPQNKPFSAPLALFLFFQQLICPQRHVLDFFALWRAFVKSLVESCHVKSLVEFLNQPYSY